MQPSVRINLLFQPRRWSIFVFFFTGDILCKASQLSESQVRPVWVHSSATYQNRYLAGFVIKSLQLDDWLQCLMTCESFPECISYNFNPRLRRCDINSRGITGSKGQQCLAEESLIFSQDSIFQQIKGRCAMNFAFFLFGWFSSPYSRDFHSSVWHFLCSHNIGNFHPFCMRIVVGSLNIPRQKTWKPNSGIETAWQLIMGQL